MSELGQVMAPSSSPKSDEHMLMYRAHQASENEWSTAQVLCFEGG